MWSYQLCNHSRVGTSHFFWVQIFTLPKTWRFFCCKFNDFLKANCQDLKTVSTKSLKISTCLHMVQVGGWTYIRMLKFFLSYFVSSQFFLNCLVMITTLPTSQNWEKKRVGSSATFLQIFTNFQPEIILWSHEPI